MAIVVPVHNGAPTLQACLDAILKAPGPRREIIVVDDGSTDGSAEIAENLGIKTIRQQNRGDSAARNCGVERTSAAICVFVDADVVVHPAALDRIASFMASNPDYVAVFGSYDADPPDPTFVSQYRNLLHHLTHQTGDPEAETFWTGIGAIRRSVFEQAGGFSPGFDPIADVALGIALHETGYRIRLDRKLMGTHLKIWTLGTIVSTDIFSRALPWGKLILNRGRLGSGLGTQLIDRYSVGLAAATVPLAALALIVPSLGFFAAICLFTSLATQASVFRQFWKMRGLIFAASIVPLQFLHRLCAATGFSLAIAQYAIDQVARAFGRISPKPSEAIAQDPMVGEWNNFDTPRVVLTDHHIR